MSNDSKLSAATNHHAETVKACLFITRRYVEMLGIDLKECQDPGATIKAIAECLGYGVKK